MQGVITTALKMLLCISLTVWSLKTPLRHDPALALAQQNATSLAESHGHSHETAFDDMWAQHGHSHDAADHDHNSALPLQEFEPSIEIVVGDKRALHTGPYRAAPIFGTDPPPRVWM